MDFIAEQDLTPARLLELFKRVGVPAEIVSASCVVARPAEAGEGYSPELPVVVVELDTATRTVRFVAFYAFREHLTPDARRAFANRLNGEMVLCRFFVHNDRPDRLTSDYALPIAGGLPVAQFMAGFDLHASVTATAVHALDPDGSALC